MTKPSFTTKKCPECHEALEYLGPYETQGKVVAYWGHRIPLEKFTASCKHMERAE